MSEVLYHFTSKEGAASILGGGFVGAVWLSPHPAAVCGEQARGVLLEVRLGGQLGPYKQEVREEEVDPLTEEPVPGGQVDVHYWYEVPAEVVNTRGKVRALGAEERRRLLAGLDDPPEE